MLDAAYWSHGIKTGSRPMFVCLLPERRIKIYITCRNAARGGLSHDHCGTTGNMHKNLVNSGHAVFELCKLTDRQTDRETNKQTNRHTHYNTSHPSRGEVIMIN